MVICLFPSDVAIDYLLFIGDKPFKLVLKHYTPQT